MQTRLLAALALIFALRGPSATSANASDSGTIYCEPGTYKNDSSGSSLCTLCETGKYAREQGQLQWRVQGQTIHPWRDQPGTPTPELWHHDLLHRDGSPFDQEEVDTFRKLTAPG